MTTDFGREIRSRREALQWTQQRLAEMSGVQTPTVSNIETGKQQPTDRVRARLLSALEAASSMPTPDRVSIIDRKASYPGTKVVEILESGMVLTLDGDRATMWKVTRMR
jgi:transcriptional regulator with XRE-family HTH domain